MVIDEVRTLDPLDHAERPDRLWDSTAEDMLATILASERHPSSAARARADRAGRGWLHGGRRDRRPGAARPRWGAPRLALQALAALVLLGTALYSVPVTRAALEDAGASVGGAFSGWLGGDSADAPGRPLEASEKLPEYMEYLHDSKEPRVIAEAGRYKLYSYIGSDGRTLNFELVGTGVGLGYESAAKFGDAPLHLLDPGARRHADAEGHVPLFGLAARSVASVELTYESGPPLRVSGVEGGFVLLAEPGRGPTEVIALDRGGREIGREPIDYPLVDESPEAPPPGIEGSGRGSSGSQEP